jgi:hypothetical protein
MDTVLFKFVTVGIQVRIVIIIIYVIFREPNGSHVSPSGSFALTSKHVAADEPLTVWSYTIVTVTGCMICFRLRKAPSLLV